MIATLEKNYFEFVAENEGQRVSMRISADSNLTATVEAFQRFLCAAGFVIEPGLHLDLVEDDA